METKARGQGLVEFALILPILLLLLLGVIEGARMVWAYITIQEAAREAARYAVSGQPYNATGDPWSFGSDISDGYAGLCLQGIDDFGTCDTQDPSALDAIDRVEAISNVAVRQARGLPVARYAISTATYTATGYYDQPETLGVLVKGQTVDHPTGIENNAGEEGRNVWVSVYYNVEFMDPIYTSLIKAITGGKTFVRIRGGAQMQNEGVDTALGSVPPAGIATPVIPEGGSPGGSSTLSPIILSPDGNSFEAGSTMRVRLEQHTAGNHYDIHLGDQIICAYVEANNFGIAEVDCAIPPDYPPGEDYELFSTLSGDTVKVAGGVFIDVIRLGQPTLLVAEGYTWPAGSGITLQVRSHEPNTAYDLLFHGGIVGTVVTNEYGDADYNWTIPSGTPPKESPEAPYPLESLVSGTTSPVIADSGVYVTTPQIVVRGGNTWPAGTLLLANLRRHAPNHSYEVFCDGEAAGTFATDSNGLSIATIYCTIPEDAADSPPYYTITSYDGGNLIGSVNVTVATPVGPYCVIPGGYDWPAGSAIDVRLYKHEPNRAHKIRFEEWVVVPSIDTNSFGYASIGYVIPISATAASTYTVSSYDLVLETTVAECGVTVRAAPLISVDEGAVVQPDSLIHVQLTGHAKDAVYTIWLDGQQLGSVQTDGTGVATFAYDLSLFSSAGGPFVLESRLYDTQAASTELSIVAADLEVVSIEVPETPVFNASMPITVTIRNASTVALSGVYFDTDIYIDPGHEPDPFYPYPPGDFKLWVDYLAPGASTSFVQDVVLYGSQDHTVYARTNTSKYIDEADSSNPVNNMTSVVVAPEGCGSKVDEAITTDTGLDNTFSPGWAGVGFGDGAGTASIANDLVSITSDGSSTVANNDASGGYYLYYQTASGDFDVSVRAVSQSTFGGISDYAKFGLEVRDSSASTAKKVYLFRTLDYSLQYAYRTADGGYVTRDQVSGSPSTLPVWLRITRIGNDFGLYYSTSSTTPPDDDSWVYWKTYSVSMTDPVVVGLANASYSSSTANTVTFDNFHLCLDPANTTNCGGVKEASGLAIVNATNFVDNISRSSKEWQEIAYAGRRVMQALPNTGTSYNDNYTTLSPELQYEVEVATSGTYYVWVYGAGNGGSDDSLHVGLNGAANSLSDRISLPSDNIVGWTNSTMDGVRATINDVGVGTNIINVWMREDGAWFNQILLTNNPDYVPSGDLDQSQCVASAPDEPYPPGMTICTPDDAPLLDNGDFEDNVGYQTAWQGPLAGVGTAISSYNPYEDGGEFSGRLASYDMGFAQPYLYQQFTMADWITGTTTMKLNLYKSVDDMGTSEYTDTLNVVLRTTATTPTWVSTPTLVARGSQGYGFPENYLAMNMDLIPAMAAAGFDPTYYAGQNLQLYFYDTSNSLSCTSFGPTCFNTAFYLDNIELEICTTQPIPAATEGTGTLTGELLVWIGGIPTAKQGVRVWAYRQNGAMLTTYSIHDSTYGFYLLDPGQYVIYSEWWEGSDLYNALTTVTVGAGVTYVRDLDLY